MLVSEQVASVIDVVAWLDDDGQVRSAGGFIIQMLPDANEETIAALLERLDRREPLRQRAERGELDPQELIASLLGELEYTLLGEEEVFYGCTCSELKLVSAMATLGQDEIRRIIESGEVIDVQCDYCKTPYRLGAEQLRPLLHTQ